VQYRFCNGCDWEESLCKCHQPHASSWQSWRAYHDKSSSFADSDEGYVEERQAESRLDSSGKDVSRLVWLRIECVAFKPFK
jgi:hypothetical protein